MSEEKNSTNVLDKKSTKKHSIEIIENVIVEITAASLWVYAVVKLFIFDIDSFLIGKIIPQYFWMLNLKLIFGLSFVAIIWLLFGNQKTLTWFLFIVFYPIIILFWRVPRFIFKQKSWSLAIGLTNFLLSFFSSLKYGFIMAALFLASVASLIIFDNKYILWIFVAVLFISTIIHYLRKFWFSINPSSPNIFNLYVKIVQSVNRYCQKNFALAENIKNLPAEKLNSEQIQKRTENLQSIVLYNRVCLFIAKKLRDFQNSGWKFASSIFTILSLIIFTITAFAFINYGIYKINPNVFKFSETPTLFTFFYYSFNNIIFNGISEISPVSPLSQISFMAETFLVFVLVAILITLYISVKSEKYSTELGCVIDKIEEEGKSLERVIQDDYRINSIVDALAELGKLKSGIINIILWFTKNL